nr:unnamed protein product [Callosobruchus analis]
MPGSQQFGVGSSPPPDTGQHQQKRSNIRNVEMVYLSDDEPLPSSNQTHSNSQSTIQAGHTDQTTISERVKQLNLDNKYSIDSPRHYVVFVEHKYLNVDRLHPMRLGEKLLNIGNDAKHIKEINTVGRNRIKIELDSPAAANRILSNSVFENNGLVAYIPLHLTEKKGVVKGIDTTYSEEDLLKKIVSDIPVKSVHSRGDVDTVLDNFNLKGMIEALLRNIFQSYVQPSSEGGDFNGHHYLWGSTDNNPPGLTLVDAIDDFPHLIFRNEGQPTRLTKPSANISAVDVTIISTDLLDISTWTVMSDTYGSDHFPILMNINSTTTNIDSHSTYKWRIHPHPDWNSPFYSRHSSHHHQTAVATTSHLSPQPLAAASTRLSPQHPLAAAAGQPLYHQTAELYRRPVYVAAAAAAAATQPAAAYLPAAHQVPSTG